MALVLVVLVVVVSGCVTPIVSASSLVARATTENELVASAEARRKRVEVVGNVIEVSSGRSDRTVTARAENKATTMQETLRKPFVMFDLAGEKVLAVLTDEDADVAVGLHEGQPGSLICWFSRFDRDALGQRVLVLEHCRRP